MIMGGDNYRKNTVLINDPNFNLKCSNIWWEKISLRVLERMSLLEVCVLSSSELSLET